MGRFTCPKALCEKTVRAENLGNTNCDLLLGLPFRETTLPWFGEIDQGLRIGPVESLHIHRVLHVISEIERPERRKTRQILS